MNDLVDRVKAGDRVRVVGIYRALGATTGFVSAMTARTLIIADNILVRHHLTSLSLSRKDRSLVARLVRRLPPATLLSLLARSVAPFIYGHENIKRGILMMLLGGEEKTLESGTHLRGYVAIIYIY